MKRYLLFSGSDYYPLPGWQDFIDDFTKLDEAIERGKEEKRGDFEDYLWYQVVDTKHKRIVAGTGAN